MKSNGKDIETNLSNHRKGTRRVRNWWMMPVVAMLGLPAPCWSQFKEPVLTGLTAGLGLEWGATLSSDMLEAYWVVSGGNNMCDVWEAHRESIDDPWADAEPLDIVNTERLESSPHLSTDGLTLTFASVGREGGYGGLDLWQTTRESRDAPWQEPVNMGPTINTLGNEGNATFSTDGLELIFNSGCVGPCSPSRLRRSTRDTLADEWTAPQEMRPSGRGDEVGSAAHPSLSPDGLSLYFNYPGSFGDWDVFVSKRSSLDAPFGPGENVGAPVSTSIRDTGVRVAPDGSLYYGRWSGSLRIWHAEALDTTQILPGDFNGDFLLNVLDIDLLTSEIVAGPGDSTFDVTGDGVIDKADVTAWLSDAAEHNDFSEAYLKGDSNLDGSVNAIDLNNLALSWRHDDEPRWSSGDFNADGSINALDLNELALSWQQSIPMAVSAAPVPEPSAFCLAIAGLALVWRRTKRRSIASHLGS